MRSSWILWLHATVWRTIPPTPCLDTYMNITINNLSHASRQDKLPTNPTHWLCMWSEVGSRSFWKVLAYHEMAAWCSSPNPCDHILWLYSSIFWLISLKTSVPNTRAWTVCRDNLSGWYLRKASRYALRTSTLELSCPTTMSNMRRTSGRSIETTTSPYFSRNAWRTCALFTCP